MSYTLRPYQQEAVDLAIKYMRKNSFPAMLELATGSGKSIICAEIARIMTSLSGKKVLCLCPTAELVEQNHEKYLLTGNEASIYSASIGKSLRHDVVFATEGSFKSKALEVGEQYSTVILDECHRITPTIKKIIKDMQQGNPNIRVLGMSATPFRLGTGYIYEMNEHGQLMEESVNPYFKKRLYTVGGEYLVNLGYLTKPIVGQIHAEKYNTDNIRVKANGQFDQASIDEAFVGHGKKTAGIVADVINQANIRQDKGVMFFASTVDHAKEIMASLPSYNSALVTGDTPKKERKQIIADFKAQKIKYLVNVSVLTTGFDAPHVSLIAILRATESASLLIQVVGRGLRLSEGKEDALILDYAGNIERFFPDGNLFEPQIQAYKDKPKIKDDFTCPQCSHTNTFTLRPNPDKMVYDAQGFFLNLDGERYVFDDGKQYPAHFGRRCTHIEERGLNNFERCTFFWDYKECQECGAENDIAARKCGSCKKLLIDPNNKLVGTTLDYKNDLSQIQTDIIVRMSKRATMSKSGNPMFKVFFKTPYRDFVAFFSDRVNKRFYEMLSDNNFKPKTVSYKKSSKTDFFTVVDFDRQEDVVR